MKGFAYLLKLEADQNHNRYYRMVQEGDRFKIEMGRIGARPVHDPAYDIMGHYIPEKNQRRI